jgi:hypothetical protein
MFHDLPTELKEHSSNFGTHADSMAWSAAVSSDLLFKELIGISRRPPQDVAQRLRSSTLVSVHHTVLMLLERTVARVTAGHQEIALVSFFHDFFQFQVANHINQFWNHHVDRILSTFGQPLVNSPEPPCLELQLFTWCFRPFLLIMLKAFNIREPKANCKYKHERLHSKFTTFKTRWNLEVFEPHKGSLENITSPQQLKIPDLKITRGMMYFLIEELANTDSKIATIQFLGDELGLFLHEYDPNIVRTHISFWYLFLKEIPEFFNEHLVSTINLFHENQLVIYKQTKQAALKRAHVTVGKHIVSDFPAQQLWTVLTFNRLTTGIFPNG